MNNKLTVGVKWWVKEALQDKETRVFAVTGGLGAGKTDGGATWHHDRVTRNPRSQFSWFFEPTYRKIEDAGIPKYKIALERFGYLEGIHYRITKSPHYKLTYKSSGQEVHFHSYDRPDLIVATEISHATLDEAGDADVTAFRNIRSRIREKRADLRQFLVMGAPQGVNWFAEEFDSDTIEGWDRSIPRDHFLYSKKYRRFTLWTDDNIENLADDYIDILDDTYGHNQNMIKSYRFGLFCPLTEGVACPNYIPQKHDLSFDLDANPSRDIDLTWDFNANPLAWISLQCVPFDEYDRRKLRYVAIHESSVNVGNLDDAVIEFAHKHPVDRFYNTLISIYGDRSGHSGSHRVRESDYDRIKNLLNQLGYQRVEIKAHKVNPLETDSVEALQRAFLEDYLYLNKSLNGVRKSLMATTWKQGTRKIDKPAGEKHTHKFDALKYHAYAVINKFRGERQQEARLIW